MCTAYRPHWSLYISSIRRAAGGTPVITLLVLELPFLSSYLNARPLFHFLSFDFTVICKSSINQCVYPTLTKSFLGLISGRCWVHQGSNRGKHFSPGFGPLSSDSVWSQQGHQRPGVGCHVNWTLHTEHPLPLFEKSRIVIPVVGFSYLPWEEYAQELKSIILRQSGNKGACV